MLPLFPIPASPDRPAHGGAGSGHAYVAWLGGRRPGRSDACAASGSPVPASRAHRCSGGWDCVGWTGPALRCWGCLVRQEIKQRRCSLGDRSRAAGIWGKHPELSKVPRSLLPFWSQGWTLPGITPLGLFSRVAARFAESGAGQGECPGGSGDGAGPEQPGLSFLCAAEFF